MSGIRSLPLRLASGLAGAAMLSGCGAVPFLDDDVGVTGTDEQALRAAADDVIDALADSDTGRAVAYINPACEVTEPELESLLEDFDEFFSELGVSVEDFYGANRITGVSVEGPVGIVTQISDPIPGFEDSESDPEDTEWIVVDDRWVIASCEGYETFDETIELDGSQGDGDTSFDEESAAVDPVLEPVLEPVTPPTPTSTTAPAPPSTTAPAPPTTPAPPPETAPATAAPTPTKLDASFIVASVSSELPPFRDLGYGAANLFDGVLETAWNHCGECTGDDGVGQRITIGFTEPVTVVGIRIANGYQKETNNVFARNHRVAQMTVSTIEASTSETLVLADVKGYQLFSLPKVETTGLFLDIDAIHAGSDYPDLAVSEIEIFVLPTP